MIKMVCMVGIGGFVGSVLRFLVSKWLNEGTTGCIPWGTWTVNVLGCLLIGVLYGGLERGSALSPEMRTLLTVGFCGGLTTFSTFVNESFVMAQGRQWWLMVGYALVSLFIGFIAVYAGRWLGETLR